jgi:crotonobetainyl-CoA:carnitine CoA-transferase CaiB-like acyl-CoA transferase
MNMEAFAGIAYRNGYPGGLPRSPNITDASAGWHAAFGLACALWARDRHACGVRVEVRLSEVAAAIAAEAVVVASAHGVLLGGAGNQSLDGGPQGIFPCQPEDSLAQAHCSVAVSIADDAQWLALREVLGHPSWSRDAALLAASGRQALADFLDERLSSWFADQIGPRVVERLVRAGIPAALVEDGGMVLRNPHLAARGCFTTLQHPVCGPLKYAGLPIRVTIGTQQLPTGHYRHAPTWGEDNVEVLRELIGIDDGDFEALEAGGSVGKYGAQPSVM